MPRIDTIPGIASLSWNAPAMRSIAPRRFLRILPTRTRPNLFGSD
jgi:hypothetical protein